MRVHAPHCCTWRPPAPTPARGSEPHLLPLPVQLWLTARTKPVATTRGAKPDGPPPLPMRTGAAAACSLQPTFCSSSAILSSRWTVCTFVGSLTQTVCYDQRCLKAHWPTSTVDAHGTLLQPAAHVAHSCHAHHPTRSVSSVWSGRSVALPPLPLPLPPLLYSRLVGRFVPSFGRGLVVVHITPPDPSTALGLAEVLLLLCYTLVSLDGLYLCWVAHR
jgi:hypothetical protein